MKKFINLYALLAMALFAGISCTDRLDDSRPIKVVSGNEISFGILQSEESVKTRTSYGDVKDNKIEINWDVNDSLQIASAQTVGSNCATYSIVESEKNKAKTLEKIGEAGLQWGGEDIKEYRFIAMYPSYGTFRADEDYASVRLDPTYNGGQGIMTGILPNAQRPDINKSFVVNNQYTFVPDMRYAYMVAKTDHKVYENEETGELNSDPVYLRFNSLVTALQFKITPGVITGNLNNVGEIDKRYQILSISLESASKPLCGNFSYTFEDDACVNTENNFESNSIIIDFASMGVDVALPSNDDEAFCDVTFFALPTYNLEKGTEDMTLKIMYKVNGIIQTKSATVNADIVPRTKHYFANVKMQNVNVETDLNVTNWFSELKPDIYISQLSIPVAGNAYSYLYSGENAHLYKQQVVSDVKTLWNLGVRGFELCTYNNNSTSTNANIGDSYISANATALPKTFKSAFEELYGYMKGTGETLVIIITGKYYNEAQTGASANAGKYNPATFVNQIEAYLDDFVADNGGDKDALFEKLTNNSTVEDLQNKIAIIIRPGDTDYTNQTGASSATVSEGWADYISLIDDWGTGIDQWDDRYDGLDDKKFFPEGAYNNSNGTSADKVTFEEKYLTWNSQRKRTSSIFGDWKDLNSGGEFPNKIIASSKKYEKTINPGSISEGTAIVQCWERIVPNSFSDMEVKPHLSGFGNETRLYINWFESYSEKIAMAEYVLDQAKSTKGAAGSNKLFINSLSGYFMTGSYGPSFYPYIGKQVSFGGDMFDAQDAGAGGDYMSCAANLNSWLYNTLKSSNTTGPYGLIMLDYIGADESVYISSSSIVAPFGKAAPTVSAAITACNELPAMILMNNFGSFPLVVKPNSNQAPPTLKFSDELLNTDNEVLDWK